jgi:hypothetical protein
LFHSFKAAVKSGGTIALATVIWLTLAVGLVACGGDETTETTVGVNTTAAEQTATTVADTVMPEAVVAVDAALVGKWASAQTGETLEFTADGKMFITAEGEPGVVEMVYVTDGTTVTVSDGTDEFPAAYSIEGDTLTMSDPGVAFPVAYRRVSE